MELVTDFFLFFSRFEYALKMSEYAESRKDSDTVQAGWNTFCRDHDKSFDPTKTQQLKAAVDYLQKKPPQKQIVKNGTLGWKPLPNQNIPELEQLLLYIRKVRDNLFHGGKYHDGLVQEPSRDTKLLKSCLTILKECLTLDAEVYDKFFAVEL